MRILIVVASDTGRTRRLATALAEGAEEAGAEVVVRSAEEATVEETESADAIVLGSGVHMGGVEASMRGFLERTSPLWLQGKLTGRVGAAFVSSGQGGRGGAELALLSLLSALAEHGLLLVSMPNRLEGFAQAGSQWGPVSWTNPRRGEPGPTAVHLVAAQSHGRHIAECTARWLRGRDSAGDE